LSHYHPEGTVLGASAKYGRRLRKVLDKFPQVISLSGHTHCPLANERMIWQGAFTESTHRRFITDAIPETR
jgi:hypothetical protein